MDRYLAVLNGRVIGSSCYLDYVMLLKISNPEVRIIDTWDDIWDV